MDSVSQSGLAFDGRAQVFRALLVHEQERDHAHLW